jgi:hypothetical protein
MSPCGTVAVWDRVIRRHGPVTKYSSTICLIVDVTPTIAHRVRLTLAAALLLLWPITAQAATCTWSGSGSDNKWSTGLNWFGTDCANRAPRNGDAVVFPLGPQKDVFFIRNDFLFSGGTNATGSRLP